jgi:alpha-galactosidase
MRTRRHIAILKSIAASLAISGSASAITETILSDNFTTANSSDPNLNLVSRQAGALATRSYNKQRDLGGTALGIASNQLSTGSDTHINLLGDNTDFTNLLKSSAYTRFTIRFDAQVTGTSWSSPYLSTHGSGGDDRGDSRLGLLFFESGGISAYKGTGAAQESQSLSAAELTTILGAWDIRARNSYTWVATKTSATTGTYRVLINGKIVFDNLPYSLNNATTQRWNVRNIANGTALYDDLAFEVYTPHPLSPVPEDGAIIPGGNVALNWTNLSPHIGSNVWVDVWFGTDPANLTKVLDGGLNATTTNVNVSTSGTYFWRVDSYLDGDPDGTPFQTSVISFIVQDTDGDGLPDFYELAYTNPPSSTALTPSGNPDNDGLTNLEEYQIGTNPTLADTDGDSLLDGPELTGVGSRPPTNPLSADTDGDGLSDGVESNTGIWGGTGNTGTNPTLADTDADGLKDGVETNTGTYVSRTNSGSNPLVKDTDNDGAWDYYEATASFTNPSDAASKPNIPYPLPAPDGTHGDPVKPVKVYIMAGQSNMVGIGYIPGTNPGSLETMTFRESKFPNFLNGGAYSTRNDVIYKGFVTATAAGGLTAGMGTNGTSVGVELGFGHVMGYYHAEPVLLLKASEGNRSLGWDFLPPGSPRWTSGGLTYAGYWDTEPSWPTGSTPGDVGWYGGRQYDACFNAVKSVLNSNGTLQGMPTVGGQSLNGRAYEIAGFVWWQGHKDQDGGSIYSTRYAFNLPNLITQLRSNFNAPNAPFVLGTIGFGGAPLEGKSAAFQAVYNAQMSVSNPANKVKTVDTFPYWRGTAESPGTQDFHYNNNAETYTLVGDALARAMIDLQVDESPPTPNPMTFAIAPTSAGTGSVGMVATTATDVSGPVEYWFQNTTNGNNSGWITSTTWINTGLTNGVSYNFQVKARDSKQQETALSAVASGIAGPDNTAPTPSPMTFASPPAATGSTTITMTATTATDLNGVQYYFDCSTVGGPDSGWQSSPVFNATGLNPATPYTYVVRAKDSAGNTTANSTPASATTDDPAAALPLVFDDFSTYSNGNINGQTGAPVGFEAAAWQSSGALTPTTVSGGVVSCSGNAFRTHRALSPALTAGTVYFRTRMALGTAPGSFQSLELSVAENNGDTNAVRLVGGSSLYVDVRGGGTGSGVITTNNGAYREWLIELNLATRAGKVWIDGNIPAFDPETGGTAFTASAGFALNAINIASFAASGETPTVAIDEIRIGESWHSIGVTVVSDDFAQWIGGFGLAPADQGFGLDPDGDGLANGLEAWFGTHPNEFSAGLTGFTRNGSTITFTHPQNENTPGDISSFYQWSPNLVDWYATDGVDSIPGGPTVTTVATPAGAMTTVTATASGAMNGLFLRVRVEQN